MFGYSYIFCIWGILEFWITGILGIIYACVFPGRARARARSASSATAAAGTASAAGACAYRARARAHAHAHTHTHTHTHKYTHTRTHAQTGAHAHTREHPAQVGKSRQVRHAYGLNDSMIHGLMNATARAQCFGKSQRHGPMPRAPATGSCHGQGLMPDYDHRSRIGHCKALARKLLRDDPFHEGHPSMRDAALDAANLHGLWASLGFHGVPGLRASLGF